jgi:hypothetical protein
VIKIEGNTPRVWLGLKIKSALSESPLMAMEEVM